LLVRLVVTDGATCRGAENAMVAGKMPRHSTHNGALDAAFGLGWRRYSDEYHRNGGVFEDLFHHLLPVESTKTTFNTRLVRIVPPDWIRQSVSRTQRTASATRENPVAITKKHRAGVGVTGNLKKGTNSQRCRRLQTEEARPRDIDVDVMRERRLLALSFPGDGFSYAGLRL
jgi:hypothetical protein